MRKLTDEKPNLSAQHKKVIIFGAILLIIALVILCISIFISPKPSVAAYCGAYKEEKTRLEKLPGETWPSGVFNDSVGDAGEFVTSFKRLENVAPNEVRGDVTALKGVYQKIDNDPSQAVNASLSGSHADESLKKWTVRTCR